MKRLLFIFALLALAGCTSKGARRGYTHIETEFVGPLAPTNAPIAVAAPPPPPAASSAVPSPADRFAALAPAEPIDPNAPLKIVLTHGSRTAKIDGALVHLSRDSVQSIKTKKTAPSAVDARTMITPLLNAHTQPLLTSRPMRVFIDPGHGGADSGAVTADKKEHESKIVLEISKQLAKLLQGAGFEVQLSRNDNLRNQTLEERTHKANAWKADIFVSIHMNSNASPEAGGVETYILTPVGELSTNGGAPADTASPPEPGNANDIRNAQLGFAVHRRLAALPQLYDRGLRRARFAVLREAKMPAVLVECGFITSNRNLRFATSAEGRDTIARSIFDGICDYAYGNFSPKRIEYSSNAAD